MNYKEITTRIKNGYQIWKKERVNSWKSIKMILKAQRKKGIFYFARAKFQSRNFLQYWFTYIITRYSFALISLLYWILVWLILDRLPISLNNDQAKSLFTTIGAMLGGILAIVFTLSTLLIQNTANESSAGFYETLANSKVQKFGFWLITASTLYFFYLGIAFDTNLAFHKLATKFGFSFLCLDLWFLYILYQDLFRRINPTHNLRAIKREAFEYLKSRQKAAESTAALMLLIPDPTQEATPETALAASYGWLSQDFQSNLQPRLNYLFDYHDKLLARQENNTAKRVLTTIGEIIAGYLRLRSTSSMILPSFDYAMFVGVSDSQNILTPATEQLIAKGRAYIKRGDDSGAIHIIDILTDLAIISASVKHTNEVQVSNPLFSLFKGYLSQLIDTAIQERNTEALFRAAHAYSRIGVTAAKHKSSEDLYSVYDPLNKIAYYSVANKEDVVMANVFSAYENILFALMLSKPHRHEVEVSSFFKHIQIPLCLFILQSFSLSSLAQTRSSQLFAQMENIIGKILDNIEEAKSDREKSAWKSALLTFTDEISSILRHISDKVPFVDYFLINQFSRLISQIGELLLELSHKPGWENERKEVINQVGWYVFQPSNFSSKASKIKANSVFDDLVEATTKIGLKALSLGETEIALDAVKGLSHMCGHVMAKEEEAHGNTEIEIMDNMAYLGMYALKQGQYEVARAVKNNILPFEKKYEEKYFANLPPEITNTHPRRNQLFISILNFDSGFRKRKWNLHRSIFMDHTDDRILELIEREDVQWFIFFVWRVTLEPNLITEGFLRKRLISCLKKRSQQNQ